MRLAGVVLALVLIAACPPRRPRVVYLAPACPAPVVSVMPQPTPPGPLKGARAVDPAVERHLNEWEKKVAWVTSFRAEIALKRTDTVFKKETSYTGSVLCLKPNYTVLRLNNAADPTKADYEAYICDGKSLFAYDGSQKTITEFAFPLKWPFRALSAEGNPVLELLVGVKAKEALERFDITVFKQDEHYLYLDIKPLASEDKREFALARVALYAGEAPARLAYLPAQVYVLKPNGDSEMWKFTSPQTDIRGVTADNFKFVPIPGWQNRKPLPPLAAEQPPAP